MSVVDQIAGYQAVANRTRGRSSHPAWSLKQRFTYPHRPEHRTLIQAYIDAEEKHLGEIEVLKFGLSHPEISKNAQELKNCEDKISAAKEVLEQAWAELSAYNNHTPQQRIALYEDEITRLTPVLEEARQRQIEYTQELLNDPRAAQRRLERQLNGGDGAEYSPQQLAELRALKDNVRTIEATISQCEQDIENIHALVTKAEKEAEIKSAIEKVLPEFNLACCQLIKAYQELKNVAVEQGIEFSLGEVGLPKEAIFRQATAPYQSSIIKVLI